MPRRTIPGTSIATWPSTLSSSASMLSSRYALWVCGLFLITACSRDKASASRNEMPKDTALTNDLRKASAGSSAYGDAADIAMAPIPDSELDRPAAPVRMRVVATTPGRAPQPAPVGASLPPSTNACDSPGTADQRRCLMSMLSRSDVGLDHTYQSLIGALDRQAGIAAGDPEPATVQQLRQAQRAWLVYRDTECRRRNRGTEGPLWAPVRARCLGEFSHDREQELADALAKVNGR